ncbi:hypothetical protein U732_2824 [Clostridium argentinense CDC 2741]|uniref:Uncharacterized protein n=1 Tax=Clostridium argentinense CDC 2741 TaxID=1418104 RepID=A0A0C1UCT4_9CLOT|nr:hypothetical protein [Clostridium argentinense]KIE45330.1 hypothetical protein U732_2824 [Clostridium argentinense CDC 2741]
METSWWVNFLMGFNIFNEALKGIGLVFLIILMFKIIKVLNIYINKNKEDRGEKNE